MTRCWDITPENRPLFGDIAENLSTILGSNEQAFVNESECVDLGYGRDHHPENADVNESENQQFTGNGEEYELKSFLRKH